MSGRPQGVAGPPAVVAPADRPLRGTAVVPGDKSISHRAALIAALARGTTAVRGFSPAGDCGATLDVLAALGVRVARVGDDVLIEGRARLDPPDRPLDCRRSGTTMRLLAGILAGAPFRSVLTGDPQLLRRPMDRVADPLRRMGAAVRLSEGGTAPMDIQGGALRGIRYRLPVASAQVKSAVLLAGLGAEGRTVVEEDVSTRDHTERLLAAAGVPVRRERRGAGARVTVDPGLPEPLDLDVPGDLSSAASLVAAAALVSGSDVVLRGVGVNPTRTGFLEVLARMGAAVEVAEEPDGPEPRGTLRVRGVALEGAAVDAEEVPAMIDELPLLGVLGTQAEGVTEVRGAGELRVKESDRISALVAGLRGLGADAEELEDGFVVRGPAPLHGGRADAAGDHRLAMTFAVAGLVARGPVEVSGAEYVADSFPGFLDELERLR